MWRYWIFPIKHILEEKVLQFDCDNAENYLSFYEENAFVGHECRQTKYKIKKKI